MRAPADQPSGSGQSLERRLADAVAVLETTYGSLPDELVDRWYRARVHDAMRRYVDDLIPEGEQIDFNFEKARVRFDLLFGRFIDDILLGAPSSLSLRGGRNTYAIGYPTDAKVGPRSRTRALVMKRNAVLGCSEGLHDLGHPFRWATLEERIDTALLHRALLEQKRLFIEGAGGLAR